MLSWPILFEAIFASHLAMPESFLRQTFIERISEMVNEEQLFLLHEVLLIKNNKTLQMAAGFYYSVI